MASPSYGTILFEEDAGTVLSMVTPSPVIAVVNSSCDLLAEPKAGARIVGTFRRNQSVEIIRDVSMEWYNVAAGDKKGWLRRQVLEIPPDPETNTSRMSKRQLESYVSIVGMDSDTSFLIWTDIDRQLTHIFERGKRGWRLNRTLVCATGKNVSPSVRGVFKIAERGSWFYSERLNSGARYWVRYDGPFLFHSLPMDRDKNITDDVLGKRQSNGCIRMSVADAAWFYRTIPEGSTVFVN